MSAGDNHSQYGVQKPWSAYMRDLYVSRHPPTLGHVAIDEIEQMAREKLKDHVSAFMYVFGSAGTNSTYAANLAEFGKYKIIPRMLRDATVRNIETTLFGIKHTSPLIIAPVGVQGIVHADAECATAAAAGKLGVTYIMSTASTRTIEAVAKANESGHRWFQLYWPRTDEITISLLKRAKASGFSALVVTLDTTLLGWRTHDIENVYLPFIHGVGAQVGFSDPVFMAKHGATPITDDDVPEFPYDTKAKDAAFQAGDKDMQRAVHLGTEWLLEANSGTFRTWEDLKILRDNWDGPIILKGILSDKDALLAMEYGMDGIVVSNHGGRQVDGAVPSLWSLNKICSDPKIKAAQQNNKFTVLFDSGVRTGSDMMKAIALGAQGILLGRPFMYGLAAGGQEGVEQVVKTLLADLEITLGLSGFKNIDEIWGKADEILTRLD